MSKKSDQAMLIQPSLLPEKPIKVRYWHAHVDSLPKKLSGPDPEPAMVRSIKSLGILQPIIVITRGKSGDLDTYEVLDGRRRLKAAREAELTHVPALIVENAEGVPIKRVLTIVANRRRSTNLAGELTAVEDLLAKHYSEAQISEATGIAKHELAKLLRLRQLINGLRLAFLDGKLAPSVAEAAAKLPVSLQGRLLKLYEKNGKLTAADVRQMHQVGVARAAQSLPETMFEPVKPVTPVGWREAVLDGLDELAALVPADEAESDDGKFVYSLLGEAQRRFVPMSEPV